MADDGELQEKKVYGAERIYRTDGGNLSAGDCRTCSKEERTELKKVMFLIYSLGSGGAERVLLDTVNHLNQEKYELTLQTLFDEKAFSNQLREGIRYRTVFSVKKTVPKKILSGFVQYLMPASLVYRLFLKMITMWKLLSWKPFQPK